MAQINSEEAQDRPELGALTRAAGEQAREHSGDEMELAICSLCSSIGLRPGP